MRLLLDTHVVLWAIARSNRLSPKGWTLLEDESNALVVSAVSVWEIALKHLLAPHAMPLSGAEALAEIRAANFELIGVTHDHAAAVENLPPHHGDPFDRLLVAQAEIEALTLLTHDNALAAYGDRVLLV